MKQEYNKAEAETKLLTASNGYVQRYEKRHGQIKIMPGLMKEPLPLESIYTAVKLLDDRSLRYFASPDDLEQAYREAGRRGLQVSSDERLDGMAIANQKQYLMVLGSPGVGKSTFLRKLGLEALKRAGQIQRQCVPVFIELKEFKEETLDLKGAIAQEFETCGFPAAAEFTAKMLDQGKLLVLLDGLDEVPTRDFNRAISHIEDFVDQYDNNAFVSSCRIAAYKASFQRFTDVTIAEFDDEQIEQFIQLWFNSELDQQAGIAQKYWKLLQQDNNKATKELAQTPLLLTFLCLVYDRRQTLPNARSTLYDKALDILLSEWAAQKRLEHDPIYEGFHPGLEKLLLSEIAHDSFEQDQLFFPKDDIISCVTEFLTDTLDAPKGLDGEKVLTAIEKQQGILVERATDTYSFSHLTLQEYLTALYIVKHQLVDNLVAEHLTDAHWREIFLLVAGLMEERVHQLLIAIEQQARTYVAKHPKVCALINWADSVINKSSEKYKPIAKRATALAIASTLSFARDSDSGRTCASASASASTFSRSLDIFRDSAVASIRASHIACNIACDIAIARCIKSVRLNAKDRSNAMEFILANHFLQKERASLRKHFRKIASTFPSTFIRELDIARNRDSDRCRFFSTLIEAQFFTLEKLGQSLTQLSHLEQSIPSEGSSSEQWRQWVNQLESTWLEALELDKEAITFSREEAEALRDYLYANELLIRCKESAVRVSKKAWEDLEARLLTLR